MPRKLSSVRALKAARDASQPLVTVCSACHNVIKQTNHAMQTDTEFADKVNRYMAQDKDAGEPYHGETVVQHYLELLRDTVGFDQVKAKPYVKPLTGKKVGAVITAACFCVPAGSCRWTTRRIPASWRI